MLWVFVSFTLNKVFELCLPRVFQIVEQCSKFQSSSTSIGADVVVSHIVHVLAKSGRLKIKTTLVLKWLSLT
jgi:hypothetical protein